MAEIAASSAELAQIRARADQGDATAQYAIGYFAWGLSGLAQDHAEAARFWRRAADKGHADATQPIMGMHPRSDDAIAQFSIGYMYESGEDGLKRDMAETVRWYRAAAAKDEVWALAQLGVCLEKGRGVARSEVEAAASYAAARALGGAEQLHGTGCQFAQAHFTIWTSAPAILTHQLTIQLFVRDLALASRLGHAQATKMLELMSCHYWRDDGGWTAWMSWIYAGMYGAMALCFALLCFRYLVWASDTRTGLSVSENHAAQRVMSSMLAEASTSRFHRQLQPWQVSSPCTSTMPVRYGRDVSRFLNVRQLPSLHLAQLFDVRYSLMSGTV
ncbi:hypothetical protein T492DRAFT_873701 [Pavlovales sp. CCMP2436]|nr:hypothetical protein T492DRAFT_873701 [Pavlovales sp. CCMP2436]